jgi:2-iminobutanoate/2-iminopropanoate deaminase
MRDIVLTDRGPKPIGPYSQAVRTNGFLFVSGQIAIDPQTGELVGAGIAAPPARICTMWSKPLFF